MSSAYEAQLVVQATRINTLSKLTFGDSKRFDGLLRDIFPGVDLRDIEYETLRQALHEIYKDQHLTINEMQVRPERGFLFEFCTFDFGRFARRWNLTNKYGNAWAL